MHDRERLSTIVLHSRSSAQKCDDGDDSRDKMLLQLTRLHRCWLNEAFVGQ